MQNEINTLKIALEKQKEEIKSNAIFSLQTSFECKGYEDIPIHGIDCLICCEYIDKPNENIRVSNNFWNTGQLLRIECPHCGVIFGPLSVINKDPRRLSEDYKILYRYYQEGETPIYQRMAFEALEAIKEKSYLNYACGTWKDGISELMNEGWNIYGYEPNISYQHDAIKMDMNQLNNIKFDGLFTHNFIEHIQNPYHQFIEWNKMLKVGDRMIHSSPCFKWKFDFSNFHIFFFLGDSLEALSSRTGFKVIGYKEYKPEIDAEYTRLVIFEKISDVEFVSNGKNNIIASMNQTNKSHYDIMEQNEFLEKRIEETTALYLDIVNSKSWKLIEIIKKVLRRN